MIFYDAGELVFQNFLLSPLWVVLPNSYNSKISGNNDWDIFSP